ncbi:MAG: hypothetical protein AAF385_07065 [Pseudomonadota bacterium]
MPTDESDSALSEAYSRASNETSPESLDNAVLAMARTELTTARSGWFQPLAIAATLVIGVGFALRITDYGTVAEPELEAPGADLREFSVEQVPLELEPESQPSEKSQFADDTEPQTPAPSRVLEKRSAGKAPQVEELSRQANERARTELDDAFNQLPAALEYAPAAEVAASLDHKREQELKETHACADQSEDIVLWQSCIENLRESGEDAAAELAEEALYLRFPELKADE